MRTMDEKCKTQERGSCSTSIQKNYLAVEVSTTLTFSSEFPIATQRPRAQVFQGILHGKEPRRLIKSTPEFEVMIACPYFQYSRYKVLPSIYMRMKPKLLAWTKNLPSLIKRPHELYRHRIICKPHLTIRNIS